MSAYSLILSSVNRSKLHQLTSWGGWRAATLEWLQRGRWLDAAHLDRQYDSIESYANTVHTIPPPRCAAAQQDGGCLMVSSFPGGYCAELHDCKYRGGCNKRRGEGVLLCEIHRCEHNSDDNRKICQLPRLEASEVCSSHACPRCVMLGCSPILARENAACEGHSCPS